MSIKATLVSCIITLCAAQARADTAIAPCHDAATAADYVADFGPAGYGEPRPDCTLNWVSHGRLIGITWTAGPQDQEATIARSEQGGYTLKSSRPPHLIDIDQDGWPDLGTFTWLGMVNGDYGFFRFLPDTDSFVPYGTMNGSSFFREPNGIVVAVGRSSAAASGVEAYRAGNTGFVPLFGLYVDAGMAQQPDGPAGCRITIGGKTYENPEPLQVPGIAPEVAALIHTYCGIYDGRETQGISLMDSRIDGPFVPAQTVFHCILEGGSRSVTITADALGFTYTFGPTRGTPELQMVRTADQVRVLPENGAGPTPVGTITFNNGPFAYIVHYSADHTADVVRGLTVVEDGNTDAPVFDRTCLPDTVYDRVASLPAKDR